MIFIFIKMDFICVRLIFINVCYDGSSIVTLLIFDLSISNCILFSFSSYVNLITLLPY